MVALPQVQGVPWDVDQLLQRTPGPAAVRGSLVDSVGAGKVVAVGRARLRKSDHSASLRRQHRRDLEAGVALGAGGERDAGDEAGRPPGIPGEPARGLVAEPVVLGLPAEAQAQPLVRPQVDVGGVDALGRVPALLPAPARVLHPVADPRDPRDPAPKLDPLRLLRAHSGAVGRVPVRPEPGGAPARAAVAPVVRGADALYPRGRVNGHRHRDLRVQAEGGHLHHRVVHLIIGPLRLFVGLIAGRLQQLVRQPPQLLIVPPAVGPVLRLVPGLEQAGVGCRVKRTATGLLIRKIARARRGHCREAQADGNEHTKANRHHG
mmetsp:Transcript_34888/g.104373  ORF Transcript_34888/g.104373 Transcript_34888/m.104373 type:complete len:320 (+) Transcript_34888:1114-2073(+)